MNAEDIIKKIRHIDIQTKGWVDSLFSGAYYSRFKGQGVQFSDVRQYAYGDDVRRIDWRVSAKLNTPYIKECEEERDLQVVFAVDMSQSQFYQSKAASKLARALEVAAVLGFSAVSNGDQVGLVLFTDTVEAYVPAKQGKSHMFTVLTRMMNHQPASNQTDMHQLCQAMMNTLKRRSVVFILSDFICDNYESPFRWLAKKHDVIPIIIQDPIEKSLPEAGLVMLADSETGQQVLCDTRSSEFHSASNSLFFNREARRNQLFKSVGVAPIEVLTTEDYIVPLKHYFSLRT